MPASPHPQRDWTKQYRLGAGVYAMRDGKILMLERAKGMMIGFWSVPGGIVDPGETPQEAAARELFEEAGLIPTGPLWLVAVVPLWGYGQDFLSLRYACRCDAGDVRLSHEHSDWRWLDPLDYRTTHLSDAVIGRWHQSSPAEGSNVLGNRAGLDDFLRWHQSMS